MASLPDRFAGLRRVAWRPMVDADLAYVAALEAHPLRRPACKDVVSHEDVRVADLRPRESRAAHVVGINVVVSVEG